MASKKFFTRFLYLLMLLMLASCGQPAQLHEQRIFVFGTLVDVSVWGTDSARAEQAFAAIQADFQRMHYEWHAWEPGPLVDINQAIAEDRPAVVLPSLLPIIEQSKSLSIRSDGLFNPAIGGLLNLWGFQSSERPNGPPPSQEAIRAWVEANPSMEDVRLVDGVLTSRNRQVQLDFGAFAKGYAIDLAIARLREYGIENAIVNGGGDLRAIGRHGNRAWRVGVRHPQGVGVLAAIDVAGDESVFTSGNYERFREHEGVRYTHILDPRTGMPVTGITSVTVLHDNGAEADAAATALVVAGVHDWQRVAHALGVKAVMLVDEAGTIYMTPAMNARVSFRTTRPTNIVIGEPL